MTVTPTRRGRPLLHAALVASLLAASSYCTYALRKEEEDKAPVAVAVTDQAARGGAKGGQDGSQKWERLQNPQRSVLRGANGAVLGTFTDGARTATLTGKQRTFTEPATTQTRVVTDTWVRLLPEPWRAGAEREQWFQDWFKKYAGSEEDDLFAIAFQYGDKAPVKKDAAGVPYAGDAAFGPINPKGSVGNDLRLEQSDFYDYLGIPYTFRDGTTEQPEKPKYRAIDCSGFIRTVFGYRSRFPLTATDAGGSGLPRTANGMARSKTGVDILPLKGVAAKDRPASIDVLQPGDLVFFKLDARTADRLDHTGMFLGSDTEGHKIFISSREEANGPTIGDKGGASRLDGNGYYAATLRSAKRL
ncbi:NlpC/P60 family protein [Streptomyces sp. NPDC059982]|uniref:NlpC/P60 family protein n=1 Tax=unclassified Streptomyces TaxID=2593676 RepID=UPI0034350D17